MTPEQLYNTIISLLIAIGWYWVRGIDKKQDEDKARMDRIEAQLNSEMRGIGEHYQRRDDAREQYGQIYEALKDIKAQVQRINDKLDHKADK